MKYLFENWQKYLKEIENPEVESTPQWIVDMENLLLDAQNLYNSIPEEGKQHLTQKFEMYAQNWREEMSKQRDEEEYEMLPSMYGRKDKEGGTPLSARQAIWATKRGSIKPK